MNLCIIQARMGSIRLPNKVLKKVNGTPLLLYEIKRVQQTKKIDKIVVATTIDKADNQIEKFCRAKKISVFRGSENDVLDRYYKCALKYPDFKNIIRITGDCPLIDPKIIDATIELFEKGKYGYVSNTGKETFPDGMDIEIFTRHALTQAWHKAKLSSEREHVTQYIRKHKKFKQGNLPAPADFGHFRLTVDEPEDFEVIKFLIKNSKTTDNYLDYISLLTKNPKIMYKNMHIIRNEGLIKSLKNDEKICQIKA
ncbi:hypothetical protein A3B87_00090 [Candidatus Kuenenbacteria bacterium RIFCSPHIGHO2_02_FULL_39_13]|uniref:Acylneuraminate cytidylyltransferase n=1 Tax=Candidatus Kuenenbacteria bacterium RIFCSPHIGHO2_02_FULL_39_13 TaxID=1798561 RepID=A0A1F6FN24_9BACT|nr:MAG: hypothetical protein A3B87_00090 [Candidatus Kuenenbacteria bacterium RIFCSPHIGHO2_02_FULL_39_13]